MTTPLRLAGAAALCAALLLTACAKKTDQTTTSTDTTSTQAAADAGATPAAGAGDATAAPDGESTPAAEIPGSAAPAATTGTTSGGNGASSGGYVDLPIYPGATENKEQAMSASSNEGSIATKIYETKDDTKKVADWYKAHLPASFKGGVLTAGDKTVGTWADEHTDGDQSVVVGGDSNGGTRVQLTTKHGK